MNYQKHYNLLIETRRNRVLDQNTYYEKHHIIPKCMGGSNDKDNIIKLTAREHFIAHWLLWRIYPTKQMAFAFYLMASGIKRFNTGINRETFSSIAYEEAKIAKSKAVSENNKKYKKGHTKSDEAKKKLSDSLKGIKLTDDHKNNISRSNKGKAKSNAHRKKLSDSLKGFDWSLYTERSKKISTANSGANNVNARIVYMCDESKNVIQEFYSMQAAFLYINKIHKVSRSTFYRKILKEKIFHGFIWKY